MDENPYRPRSSNASGPRPQSKIRISAIVKLLLVLGIVPIVICLFVAITQIRDWLVPARLQCANNLRQIALALHNYATNYHAFPPAYTTDANGKPLHSWRTLILPYLEEQQLYKKIDLTKPWDDPANAEACKTVVPVKRCPIAPEPGNCTTYLAIVTPNSCLRPHEPRRQSEITANTSETLMLIEADSDHAVPWMSPNDADEQLVLGIGPDFKVAHSGGFHAAFVDCHIDFVAADMPADQRRALISIAAKDKAAAKRAN